MDVKLLVGLWTWHWSHGLAWTLVYILFAGEVEAGL